MAPTAAAPRSRIEDFMMWEVTTVHSIHNIDWDPGNGAEQALYHLCSSRRYSVWLRRSPGSCVGSILAGTQWEYMHCAQTKPLKGKQSRDLGSASWWSYDRRGEGTLLTTWFGELGTFLRRGANGRSWNGWTLGTIHCRRQTVFLLSLEMPFWDFQQMSRPRKRLTPDRP